MSIYQQLSVDMVGIISSYLTLFEFLPCQQLNSHTLAYWKTSTQIWKSFQININMLTKTITNAQKVIDSSMFCSEQPSSFDQHDDMVIDQLLNIFKSLPSITSYDFGDIITTSLLDFLIHHVLEQNFSCKYCNGGVTISK
jgi:hypothetical protein